MIREIKRTPVELQEVMQHIFPDNLPNELAQEQELDLFAKFVSDYHIVQADDSQSVKKHLLLDQVMQQILDFYHFTRANSLDRSRVFKDQNGVSWLFVSPNVVSRVTGYAENVKDNYDDSNSSYLGKHQLPVTPSDDSDRNFSLDTIILGLDSFRFPGRSFDIMFRLDQLEFLIENVSDQGFLTEFK
ncbi:hypothetical protein ABTQ33_04775 [Paucilactobacillus suebicus]|nr:hypothetical protein [Paucilactobacillus suebicus]